LKFFIHDITQYTSDITASKIGFQPPTDACHWTAADADGISAVVDTKISASAHLCEWRLSRI